MSQNLPVPAQSFEDRFMERLKEGMGTMMTEDELKKLIEKGVEKFLFAPRMRKSKDGYYEHYIEAPPLMAEALDRWLMDRMQKACDDYLKANPEKLEAALQAVLKDGLATATLRALDERYSGMTMEFIRGAVAQLGDKG